MGGAVILNWVLGAIIIVLIVGGGIYAVCPARQGRPEHPGRAPVFPGQGRPQVTPLGEHVPTERVAAAGGLTELRSPLREARQNAGSNGGSPNTRLSGDQTSEPSHDPE